MSKAYNGNKPRVGNDLEKWTVLIKLIFITRLKWQTSRPDLKELVIKQETDLNGKTIEQILGKRKFVSPETWIKLIIISLS